MTSMSSRSSPARLRAIGTALTGPTPMMLGSTPAWPHPMMRPMGLNPFSSTAFCEARTTAAAPSLMPDALPAVTDPRSEEHTSELQSLMRLSYAVFCLKKTNHKANLQHELVNTQHKKQINIRFHTLKK